MSLHRMNPESDFVLGAHPRTRFALVLAKLRPVFPELSHGRLFMYSVRMNFVCRVMSAGIPLSLVKYCLGQGDIGMLMGHLTLTPEQKLEILRRNLESFVQEL